MTGCKEEVLPTETIYWEPDGQGYLQFYTNDPAYLETICFYRVPGSYKDPVMNIDIDVKKVSGNKFVPSGFVYKCSPDYQSFTGIVFDTTGYCSTQFSRFNGEWQGLAWHQESTLNTGLGEVNNIKIVRHGDPDDHWFDFIFNDKSHIALESTKYGPGDCAFVVFIGSSDDEDFPNKPVDVRFRMRKPVVAP